MAKIGISIKLDVKKLDKARFFAANSGALYVDLTMFLDPDNEGQYGDHGFLTQSTSKEEREQQVQMPILGNGKIFYDVPLTYLDEVLFEFKDKKGNYIEFNDKNHSFTLEITEAIQKIEGVGFSGRIGART